MSQNKEGNIIVYGTRRTGTSLLMAILSHDKNLNLIEDQDKISGDDYNKLQPFYHESKFVGGIKKQYEEEYIKLGNNNLIKMMNSALSDTPMEHLDSIKKIFVMNRYWVDQNNSAKNMNLINIKNGVFQDDILYNSIKDRKRFMQEFKNDDGVEYGYHYSKLLLDMAIRGYMSKLVVINFDTLYTNPSYIKKYLKFHGVNAGNGFDLVDNRISKYKKCDREGLIEFKEGFFDYLDKLHEALRTGNITTDFMKEIHKWVIILTKNIEQTLLDLKNKYRVSFVPTN
jgi:hypothetical protein